MAEFWVRIGNVCNVQIISSFVPISCMKTSSLIQDTSFDDDNDVTCSQFDAIMSTNAITKHSSSTEFWVSLAKLYIMPFFLIVRRLGFV